MVEKKIGLLSELVIHPGETLEEAMIDRGYSQKELALRTGFSEKHISKVISGENNISPLFAKKLEYALGISSSFWNNLQRIYDEELVEYETYNKITNEEKQVVSLFDELLIAEEMRYSNNTEKIEGLRQYLHISDLTLANRLVAGNFRTQFEANVNDYIKYGFDVYAKKSVAHLAPRSKDLDIEGLKKAIPTLKGFMFFDPSEYVSLIQEELMKYGVLFNLVKDIKKAKIKGYTTKNERNQVVLVITDRDKFWHIFWFTLFHELSHVLNKDYLKKNLSDEELQKIEARANKFAEDVLIDRKAYENFLKEDRFGIDDLVRFAKEQGVYADILIGRLQKEKRMSYKMYTNLFRKIKI